jgi:hypothetical protein
VAFICDLGAAVGPKNCVDNNSQTTRPTIILVLFVDSVYIMTAPKKALNRCWRAGPRTPTGIISSRIWPRRTTTQGGTSQCHAGTGASAFSANGSCSRIRSCIGAGRCHCAFHCAVNVTRSETEPNQKSLTLLQRLLVVLVLSFLLLQPVSNLFSPYPIASTSCRAGASADHRSAL